MFSFQTGMNRDCTGRSRRDFLSLGSVGAFGLTLPEVLRAQAAQADAPDINCIMLWLVGAPSHHETFDPKPDAAKEIRGEFGVTRAKNGELFGELIPRIAAISDKFSLLKAVHHADGNHDTAQFELQSGHRFNPSITYPSFGSVVAKEKGYRNGLPPYVLFGGIKSEGAGYVGDIHNPLNIGDDPSKKGFSVREVQPPFGVKQNRYDRRQRMLSALDTFRAAAEARGEITRTMDGFVARALELVASPAAKKAFRLDDEPEPLRARYGMHRFGQSCLLARRMVEAGVRFVTVSNGGWDTHADNFSRLKNELLPPFDQAYSALLEDLDQRGMLSNTLVIAFGEFGRTPIVNPAAGRDHWPQLFPVALGGGPVKLGRVIGSSDAVGGEPTSRPVSVPELAATFYRALGVDYHKEYVTPDGRPLAIVGNVEPVSELF